MAPITNQLPQFQGKAENLKAAIKAAAEDEEETLDIDSLLADIIFSSDLNATHKEKVDSFYINHLLKALQAKEDGALAKFEAEIQNKDELVQPLYQDLKTTILNSPETVDVIALKESAIQAKIDALTEEQVQAFGLSRDFLRSAVNEYRADKQVIPYLSDLLDTMTVSKTEFEAQTGEKYRRRTKVVEQQLKDKFDIIQKWKEEL